MLVPTTFRATNAHAMRAANGAFRVPHRKRAFAQRYPHGRPAFVVHACAGTECAPGTRQMDKDVRSLRRTVGLSLLELVRSIGPALSALRAATTAESEETCDAAAMACDRVSLELRKCLTAVDGLGRALPRRSRTSIDAAAS